VHDVERRDQSGSDGASGGEGYGTGNVFHDNRVEGEIPGFGIGLYPALGNVVPCDNTASGAAEGLVGDNGQPAECTG
jgi:hypothetical protein